MLIGKKEGKRQGIMQLPVVRCLPNSERRTDESDMESSYS